MKTRGINLSLWVNAYIVLTNQNRKKSATQHKELKVSFHFLKCNQRLITAMVPQAGVPEGVDLLQPTLLLATD